jgi:hypothetical protein
LSIREKLFFCRYVWFSSVLTTVFVSNVTAFPPEDQNGLVYIDNGIPLVA